jgi:hypothetical protein
MLSLSQIMLAGAFAAGLAAASVGLSAYDRLFDDPAVALEARAEGKTAGVAEERRAWQELRDRAEIEKAQKLAAAQARINAADQKLADYRASDRRRADAIRRAYQERLSDDTSTAAPGCDCSRFPLPDRVWNELR